MAGSPLTKKAPLTGAFFFFWLISFSLQAACPIPGKLPTYNVRKVVDGEALMRRIADSTANLGDQARLERDGEYLPGAFSLGSPGA